MENANTPYGNAQKLLDRVRDKIRLRHYPLRTGKTYSKQFILFHHKRHSNEMGTAELKWVAKTALQGAHRVPSRSPKIGKCARCAPVLSN